MAAWRALKPQSPPHASAIAMSGRQLSAARFFSSGGIAGFLSSVAVCVQPAETAAKHLQRRLGHVVETPELTLTVGPAHVDNDGPLLERQWQRVQANGGQRHGRERRELVMLVLAGRTAPGSSDPAPTQSGRR